jgi:hypothetical protein
MPAELPRRTGGIDDAVARVSWAFGSKARFLLDPGGRHAKAVELPDRCGNAAAHVEDATFG